MSQDTVDYILDRISKLELDIHYLQEAAEKDTILVKRRRLNESCIFPTQAHENDAGWDLFAVEDYELPFGVPVKVSTGLSLQIPENYYVSIRDRSGLGSKGIHVLGGVVDAGYTSEYLVILVNLNSTNYKFHFGTDYDGQDYPIQTIEGIKDYKPYKIKRGDKIAQLVFSKLPKVFWSDSEFTETERGSKGFGASGR